MKRLRKLLNNGQIWILKAHIINSQITFRDNRNLDEIVDAITKDTGKVELEALSADICPS